MPDPMTAIAASGLLSAGANIFGSSNAAAGQKEAAEIASRTQLAMQQKAIDTFMKLYGAGSDALSPYLKTGADATQALNSKQTYFQDPVTMNIDDLHNTPGYEFLMKQGMRGVTGSNVLRGLSGAQIKGAESFATGLADSTYKTQWDIANQNKTNAFNRLTQTAGQGLDAGKTLLAAGTTGGGSILGNSATVGGQVGGNIISAGNAGAAASIAAGQNAGQAGASLAYAPFVANKLYPNGFPSGGSTGMYAANPFNSDGSRNNDSYPS